MRYSARVSEIVDVGLRLESLFPIGAPPFEIHVVAGATGSWVRGHEPTAVAIFRTVVWDVEPERGPTLIRDIKEQEVALGWPVLFDDHERVAAWVAAHAAVLADAELERVAAAMPSDVIHADVLGRKHARTQADFEAALRTKGRLGPYLRRR